MAPVSGDEDNSLKEEKEENNNNNNNAAAAVDDDEDNDSDDDLDFGEDEDFGLGNTKVTSVQAGTAAPAVPLPAQDQGVAHAAKKLKVGAGGAAQASGSRAWWRQRDAGGHAFRCGFPRVGALV